MLTWREAAEAPQRVHAQATTLAPILEALVARLKATPPRAVMTLARGSSDHAATFGRHLIETRLGIATGSSEPSIRSVYGIAPGLEGMACIAISQSGHSPDLVTSAAMARRGGALVIALVNDTDSPLAAEADYVLDLGAGSESAVAATKSFICSLTALARLVAYWAGDMGLLARLEALPAALADAFDLDFEQGISILRDASRLYVIGRGPGLAVAQEAALKLKETCRVHAEAVSAAELLHGPIAIVDPGFPVLVFAQDDASRPGLAHAVDALLERGARVLQVGGAPLGGTAHLPLPATEASLQPIVAIQAFYRMVLGLAMARGIDPDRPAGLQKVTRTT
ncbi:MAG: SIS domain-containing protein [Steroidobacteraceae bacterium]